MRLLHSVLPTLRQANRPQRKFVAQWTLARGYERGFDFVALNKAPEPDDPLRSRTSLGARCQFYRQKVAPHLWPRTLLEQRPGRCQRGLEISYVEYVLANRKHQMDRIFPAADSDNRAICVPGVSSTKPFSVLMVDTMPDLHFVASGQCFPRYRYERDQQGSYGQGDSMTQRI